MNVFFVLVPVALLLAGAGVAAFFWSVKTGQYDDVDTPAIRMLIDDESPSRPGASSASSRRPRTSGTDPETAPSSAGSGSG